MAKNTPSKDKEDKLQATARETLDKIEESLKQEVQEFLENKPQVVVVPRRAVVINQPGAVGGNVKPVFNHNGRNMQRINVVTDFPI